MMHSSDNELGDAARQALSLMDLTSLNDDDSDASIEALCRRARPRRSPNSLSWLNLRSSRKARQPSW